MLKTTNFTSIFREHKTLFIIIAVGLFLLELEIFAVAAMKSGRKSWLQVYDTEGVMIYQTNGSRLSDFNKYYFEKTFGPFENYTVRLETSEHPFPFRAWFAAAVGIPIGVVLLFGFVIRAWMALFHGESGLAAEDAADARTAHETRLEGIIHRVSRFNIFTIGFLVLIGAVGYWVVPNALAVIGRTSLHAIVQFKWVFIGVAAVAVGLVVWVIYLRYLLAKKTIETRAELDRFRLQLKYDQSADSTPQIPFTVVDPPEASGSLNAPSDTP